MPNEKTSTDPNAACNQCGHRIGDHSVVGLSGPIIRGGVILCPVKGCECQRVWGDDDPPSLETLTAETVAEVRDRLQAYGSEDPPVPA